MKIISLQFLFSVYGNKKFYKFFITTHLVLTLFLVLLGLYGFFFGTDHTASLTGVFFLIVVSILGNNKRFCENPFSIPFCILTFLFLSIPITFYLVNGQEYVFGVGLVDLPFRQEQYRESSPWGIIFLTLCWISIWLPITFVRPIIRSYPHSLLKIRIPNILIVGVFTWLITAIDRLEFAKVNMLGGTKEVEILSILFFVHAYLLLSGLVLILKVNEGYPLINRSVIASTAFIFFAFLSLFTLEGSKGSILSVLLLFMIYPISTLRGYRSEFVILPSVKLLLALAFLSLPIFYFVSVYRDLSNNEVGNLDTFYSAASNFDFEKLCDSVLKILYRFSMAGFDRFMLIFQSYGMGGYSFDFTMDFLMYSSKNLLNLISPGTPFLEAYSPTSQLFPSVLAKSVLFGGSTQSELMNSFNTQAFTIFGVFLILFGFMAPIFLFIYSYLIVILYNSIQYYLVRAVLIYFFSEAFLCYGLEVVIFYSIQLFFSMYFLCKVLGFRIRK